MMSLTFGLFTQVSGSGPLGPLVALQIVSFANLYVIKNLNLFWKRKTHLTAKFYKTDLHILVFLVGESPSYS